MPWAFTFQALGPSLSLYDFKEHLLAESVIMAIKDRAESYPQNLLTRLCYCTGKLTHAARQLSHSGPRRDVFAVFSEIQTGFLI